jgi:REP element-mobilizing transposase RayT
MLFAIMAATLTNLLYHFVFSTKDRRPLIDEEVEERLHAYMGGIGKGRIIEMDARKDSTKEFLMAIGLWSIHGQ